MWYQGFRLIRAVTSARWPGRSLGENGPAGNKTAITHCKSKCTQHFSKEEIETVGASGYLGGRQPRPGRIPHLHPYTDVANPLATHTKGGTAGAGRLPGHCFNFRFQSQSQTPRWQATPHPHPPTTGMHGLTGRKFRQTCAVIVHPLVWSWHSSWVRQAPTQTRGGS